jgi:phosphate-selective porin OprO and OprP
MKKFLLLSAILLITLFAKSQTTNDILNLLIENGTIDQAKADSVRAEAAIKQQESDSKKKSFQITSSKALQIGGYGQFRYQYLEEAKKIDGFDIRRAYLDIKGAMTPYWSYRLQTDFAGTPKIIDIYTELKLNDYLNFTIGQQLIPFSLNNYTSNTKLELPDRSMAVEALLSRKEDVLGDNNGRDIGISLYGSFIPINDRKFIEYRIGVFNGSGINKLDLNQDKDFIGRIILHPVKGLDIGASYYNGFTPDSVTLNNKSTDLLLGKRKRFGAELSYTYQFINVKGEYLVGKDGDVNKSGYYAQLAAFLVKDKFQLVGRYDSYDKDTDKATNILTNYTFGANYIFNPNVLIQLAYTVRKEQGTSINNNFGSVQLQLTF